MYYYIGISILITLFNRSAMMCLTCTGTSTVQDIYKKLCNIAPHCLVTRLHENAPMLSEISVENTASSKSN